MRGLRSRVEFHAFWRPNGTFTREIVFISWQPRTFIWRYGEKMHTLGMHAETRDI